MNQTQIYVIADDREQQSGVIDALKQIDCVETKIQRLRVGDYLADRSLLFERKTFNDFAISIIDGRLFGQAIRLARSEFDCVLILEGKGNTVSETGVRREALQGAIITISLVLGIPILRSRNPSETARLIVYAARQLRSIAQGAVHRGGYRPKGKKKRQAFILQGLPGIGAQMAKRLLDTFGTVEAVISASSEQLQSVEGIGQKTAEKIRWIVT